jgi:hypothetical protein
VYDFFAQWADRIDTIIPEQQAQMLKKLDIVAIWPPGQPLDITGAIDVPIDSSALYYTPGHGETSTPIRSAIP